jgi:hypothetical protein
LVFIEPLAKVFSCECETTEKVASRAGL